MEKTTTLTLINSLLIGITVNMTTYGSGQVLLMFDHKNPQVINEFNKIAFDLNSQTQPLGTPANKGSGPYTLIFKDFVIAIPLIRRLVTLGYITPVDQNQLPELFEDIETYLEVRKKIYFGLKPAQHESLENITRAKETQSLADTNPLLQALTANNLAQVRMVLDAGADVNQFLPGDTRTPLMYALHHCDLTIVQLILNYKPDIHKLNQLGYSNALGIVIGTGDYEKTRLLLEAGANVIRACMYTSTVVKHYDPLNVPMQWVSPSTYAVMKYQQDKENPERLKLVKLLMFYGAFIGTQVKADSLNIFQSRDMLLAGSYPFHAAKFPIVSLEDFKNYISIDDYPHWRTVFSRLMEYNVFHAEPMIQQTLKSALEHIELQLTRREDSSKTSATNSDTSVSPLLVDLAALSENNLNAVITKLNMSDYVEALGTACSLSNKELALKVATIILKYKGTLNFDINEPYGHGARTCLHVAGMKGNEALFNLLTAHGADEGALDKKGKTPQQWLGEQLDIKSTMTAAQLKK